MNLSIEKFLNITFMVCALTKNVLGSYIENLDN